MADYFLKSGNTRKDGQVPVKIIAPINSFRVEEYQCMTKEKFPKLWPSVPKKLDWERAITDLVLPRFNEDLVPHGRNSFVKEVTSVKHKGKDLLEIRCTIAPVEPQYRLVPEVDCVTANGKFSLDTCDMRKFYK